MADNAKADQAKNFDLKFIGDHVHIDSEGKRHDFRAGDVGHFTEAEAASIRQTGSAVLNTQRAEAVAQKDIAQGRPPVAATVASATPAQK
jgi:DUF1680 family protein